MENTQKKQFNEPNFTLYKGQSMVSFQIIKSRFDKEKDKWTKPGLLVTFMPALGKQKYDYAARQTFSMNITEIGDTMAYFRKSLKPKDNRLSFIHKPNGDFKSKNGKILAFNVPDPAVARGNAYYFSLTVEKNGEKIVLKNSLTPGEVQTLFALLQESVVLMSNWRN